MASGFYTIPALLMLLWSCTINAFVLPNSLYKPSLTSSSPYGLQTYLTESSSLATARTLNGALFATASNGIELSRILYDSTSTAFDAWEWTAGLGAPAALIAGAVLVTLSETREDFTPRKNDLKWVRIMKQSCRVLLLSSFAFELVSIFVSTITGSVLLAHGECLASKAVGYASPLGLLHHHHEFEYLTIQIGFLQGLFNWLFATGIEILIPKKDETKSARRMNVALSSMLFTLMLWITAFYNHHLSFYSDYAQMLKRYFALFFNRYVNPVRQFRPMMLLYVPSFVISTFLTWRAFRSPSEEDDEDKLATK